MEQMHSVINWWNEMGMNMMANKHEKKEIKKRKGAKKGVDIAISPLYPKPKTM